MKILILFVFSYIAITSAVSNLQFFNGTVAEAGQYPYYVLIQGCTAEYCGSLATGGVLLSSNWVLTDGFSIARKRFPFFRAILGVVDLRNEIGVQNVSVSEVVVHPGYSGEYPPGPHNLALLKLEEDVIFSDIIQPAKLAAETDEIPNELTLMGYGTDRYVGNQIGNLTPVLLAGNVTTIDFDECVEKASFRVQIDDSNFCTMDKNGDVTVCGDQGEPLVKDGVVYGIVSYDMCPVKNFPSIHAKISSHLSWIQEYVHDLK